jgi:hypothetical protein
VHDDQNTSPNDRTHYLKMWPQATSDNHRSSTQNSAACPETVLIAPNDEAAHSNKNAKPKQEDTLLENRWPQATSANVRSSTQISQAFSESVQIASDDGAVHDDENTSPNEKTHY